MSEKTKEIGVVTHYYDHLKVAVVKLKSPIKKGDIIKIVGHGTNLEQKVESMQIEHKSIEKAAKGKEIGLKVNGLVKEHDVVCKI
jgi:translation elongation factor EF-1alpha